MSDLLPQALRGLRIGSGFDVHPFEDGKPLIVGGVRFDHPRGLSGHSDGDVVAHALTDAILGATGQGDIGERFPSDGSTPQGIDSCELLARVVAEVRAHGWQLIDLDVIVIAQEPRIAPRREDIRSRLCDVIGVGADRLTVRATTTDHLGALGRREGIAAQAVCLAWSEFA